MTELTDEERMLELAVDTAEVAVVEVERLHAGITALADEFAGYGHGVFNIHLAEFPCSACELLARLRTLANPGDRGES